jgi:hypothetical protein
MLIKKTNDYLPGICSITSQVGKVNKLAFDEGKEIEVTAEQAGKINKNWFVVIEQPKIKVEVKDGK